MSKFPLLNASVRINGVDLSDHVQEVTPNLGADDVDTTSMGALGKTRVTGLRDDSFDLTFFSDMGSSSVDQTLAPLLTGGSLFLVEVWASGTTSSATNPKYSGTCIMPEYQPFSGKVGDAAMTKVKLPVSGYISRATS